MVRRLAIALVALVALDGALPARADGPPAGEAAAAPAVSIHRLEAAAHRGELRSVIPAAPGLATRTPLQPRIAAPAKQVHGFHPYWMGTSYTQYDWALLTTVAFFALDLDATGAIVDAHGWPWTGLVTTAHAHGVRVTVTATLFDSNALNTLLANAANRQNAIGHLVNAVVQGGADGVCVDFEGVPGTRKADLVGFLGELHAALQAALAQPYLAIATPAVDWGNAFDYDQLAARCDNLVVMAYDYHWANSSTTGPVAPLAGWGTYNVEWTIQDYIYWGTPPGKILLGVPYYGYRWPAASGTAGASTLGTAVSQTYAQAAAGATTYGALWDVPGASPWFRYQDPTWQQTWYDDDQSLGTKYDRVWIDRLGGVSLWALGYDGTRPELWSALRQAFGARTADVAPGLGLPVLTLASAGPNPTASQAVFELQSSTRTPISLEVFAATGALVRTLVAGAAAAPRTTVIWDGRDRAGRPVPSGVYYARATAGGARAAARTVIVR